MFWGLIMEPLKRYSQVVGRSFHVSQVALDVSTGDNEPSQVMVVIDEQKFLICTLQKGKTIQADVDLNFSKGESIAFVANGKCHIHLTGYLDPFEDMEDDMEEEEASDEEEEEDEEVPQLVEANNKKAKRKLDTSVEMNNSKKLKKEGKKKVEKDSESSDDNSEDDSDSPDESDLRKLLEASDSDEADESYRPDTSKDDEESEDEEDMDADELNEDGDDSDEKTTPQKEEKKLSKKERKKLKKQQMEQQGTPQQNGFAEKKKDKGNKENDQKKSDGEKSPGSAQKEKKVLTGNVAIEDLKVGQGAPAKPGKMIQVYYEGRLKSNNKMFDSCSKGPGFKFRLGKNEVIRGWDVGVAGMKVGGKRRIVCPPGMAYGNKGSPPLIPPNSTLVFDVELKGVN